MTTEYAIRSARTARDHANEAWGIIDEDPEAERFGKELVWFAYHNTAAVLWGFLAVVLILILLPLVLLSILFRHMYRLLVWIGTWIREFVEWLGNRLTRGADNR